MTRQAEQRAQRAQFWIFFAIGLVGIVVLGFQEADAIRQSVADVPDLENFPTPVLVAAALFQPAVLLAAAVWAGIRFARRVGLKSRITSAILGEKDPWSSMRYDLGASIGVGLFTGAAVLALDVVFQPHLDAHWRELARTSSYTTGELIGGLLYGGLTEELMLRFGLMSFFMWAGCRMSGNQHGRPNARVISVAIALTALMFGVGHLPYVASQFDLDFAFASRTIILNAVAGVAFGLVYWRRNLETAMLAHATSHVFFAGVAEWTTLLQT